MKKFINTSIKILIKLCFTTYILGVFNTVQALTFYESSIGDTSVRAGTNIGTLDLGNNTIFGTVNNLSRSSSNRDPSDGFVFSLPINSKLIKASITNLGNIIDPEINYSIGQVQLKTSSTGFFNGNLVRELNDVTFKDGEVLFNVKNLNLNETNNTFFIGNGGGGGLSGQTAKYVYSLEVVSTKETVSTKVPESSPVLGLLFIGGICTTLYFDKKLSSNNKKCIN